MIQSVVGALSSFASRFEATGTDMEPDASECEPIASSSNTAGDKPLFRLFVGWVPKLFTERDLLPLFQRFGDVKDIIILKDKVTGQPRGCAFVSYATKDEAEAAIAALDKGVHLPGALCPLEVRYARSHQYVQAGSGPEDNRQLFFARAPVTTTEEQLRQLFEQFGQVEEVNLFRERRTHLSKGCGFVTMHTRDQAVAAMAALDEKHMLEGSQTPLALKWADPQLQIKKRQAVEDSNAENRMLFFAKVLRSANEDEVRALFSTFGHVVEVNLFRAFQGAPTTKGCGLVTLASNEEAAAAIDALDNKHVWEGMEAPMVVKWMDAALQKRRREEHLAAMRQGLVPSMGSDLWVAPRGPGLGSSGSLLGPAAGLSASGKLMDASSGGVGGYEGAAAAAAGPMPGGSGTGLFSEVLPAGCAPDAYKLFVGNVPKSCTEEELRPLFESIGPVVELVVVRDKFSHESKGSAFVWFTNKADADTAVLTYNLQRVLPDPTGEQDRPLVVRRANMRKPASALMMPGGGLGGGGGGAAAAAAAAAGMSGNTAMSSSSNVGGVGGSGSLGMGMGLGPRRGGWQGMEGMQGDMGGAAAPYYMLPQQQPHQQQQQQFAAMQAQQQQQQQQQYMQRAPMMYQQSVAMQVTPITSASDNSGSGSFMLTPYGVAVAQAGLSGPTVMAMQQQQVQQQQVQQQQQQQAQQMASSPQQPQPQPQQQAYYLGAGGMQAVMVSPAAQGPGMPAMAGAGGVDYRQQPAHPQVQQQHVQQQGLLPAGMGGGSDGGGRAPEPAMGPMVQISLQVTSQQMGLLSGQLYSVGAMSGADLVSAPAAAGVFHITLTGAQSQVSVARQLITSLLSQVGIM